MGHGYDAKVSVYADERVEMLARIYREDELIQSAHRIRPMLHPNKTIYMLTNLPIDELSPTRLVTVDELGDQLRPTPVEEEGITLKAAGEVAETLMETEGVVWGKRFKAALAQRFHTFTKKDTNNEGVERQDSCGLDFPSDETLRRWLKVIAKQHGWNRSRVTIERNDRGGGASWIVVYHISDIDEAFVRANYAVAWDIEPQDTLTIEPFPTDSPSPPEDEDLQGVQQEIEWCPQRE